MLVLKDGVYPVVEGDPKRLGTECLACEYECWFRGNKAITIEAPIPGLDEYRKKHRNILTKEGGENMAILLTKSTKVVVQGITGREGSMRAKFMRRMGTNVVAGVTPGRGGEEVDGIPVYNTVKDAVKNHGLFDVSVTFIPGTGLKDAVFEALDSDIKWIVMPVERVPLYDILEMVAYGKAEGRHAPGARLHRRQHPGGRRPRMAGRFGRIRQQAFRAGPCRRHLPQRRAVGDASRT